jgi:hypothetical protein
LADKLQVMNSDDILEFFSMDEDQILERVDEYTLYCFYLKDIIGEEPIIRKGYNSPVRVPGETYDDAPSFGLYYTTTIAGREFLWIDQARNRKGDIFKLVQLLYGLDNRREALRQVCSDFGLGAKVEAREKITLYEKKERLTGDIRVASRVFKSHELDWWWTKFHVNRDQLEFFNTTAPKYYWINELQHNPFIPKDMTFAFRILDRYQIYRPYPPERRFKFRNDFTDNCIPGASQLRFRTDTLLITKAIKDTSCLDSFKEFDILAGRGENVMIPDKFMRYLQTKFKYIITFMDNDGKNHTAPKYQEQYGAMSLVVPQDIQKSKDPAGYCENYGYKQLYEYTKYGLEVLKTADEAYLRNLRGKRVSVRNSTPFTVSNISAAYSEDFKLVLILFGLGKKFYINMEALKQDIYVYS